MVCNGRRLRALMDQSSADGPEFVWMILPFSGNFTSAVQPLQGPVDGSLSLQPWTIAAASTPDQRYIAAVSGTAREQGAAHMKHRQGATTRGRRDEVSSANRPAGGEVKGEGEH